MEKDTFESELVCEKLTHSPSLQPSFHMGCVRFIEKSDLLLNSNSSVNSSEGVQLLHPLLCTPALSLDCVQLTTVPQGHHRTLGCGHSSLRTFWWK